MEPKLKLLTQRLEFILDREISEEKVRLLLDSGILQSFFDEKISEEKLRSIADVVPDLAEAAHPLNRGSLRAGIDLDPAYPIMITIGKHTQLTSKAFKSEGLKDWKIRHNFEPVGTVLKTKVSLPSLVGKDRKTNLSLREHISLLDRMGFIPLGQHAAEEIIRCVPDTWQAYTLLFPSTIYERGGRRCGIVGIPRVVRGKTQNLVLIETSADFSAKEYRMPCVRRSDLPESMTAVSFLELAT
jgi:hypothetical protein